MLRGPIGRCRLANSEMDSFVWSKNDGLPTGTSIEQQVTEEKVAKLLLNHEPSDLVLDRQAHAKFCAKGLGGVGQGYQCLDASRPWIVYWITHALDLLGDDKEIEERGSAIVSFLSHCVNKGGYGGGPMQRGHLAPTYAAINALAVVGTEEAFASVDRVGVYKFLMSRKTPDGAFTMHEGGEVDVRGVYTAMSVASLLNIITPELVEGVPEWVAKCQTYEGGLSGEHGTEAHGGYAFCGLAALTILNRTDVLDIPKLLQWAVDRQMAEGGFQGRTNKLVDSCYSFWVGGLFPLLGALVSKDSQPTSVDELRYDTWLCDQGTLSKYILVAAQCSGGGLRDKPGKSRDYYHTCYALSGLSIAQNNHSDPNKCYLTRGQEDQLTLHSDLTNFLPQYFNSTRKQRPIHPLYNVTAVKANRCLEYFSKQPDITTLL